MHRRLLLSSATTAVDLERNVDLCRWQQDSVEMLTTYLGISGTKHGKIEQRSHLPCVHIQSSAVVPQQDQPSGSLNSVSMLWPYSILLYWKSAASTLNVSMWGEVQILTSDAGFNIAAALRPNFIAVDRCKRLKAHAAHEGRLARYEMALAAKFYLQALVMTTTIVVIVALAEGGFVGRTKVLGHRENSRSRELPSRNISHKRKKRVRPGGR